MNDAKLLLLETEARNGELATAIAEDGSLGEEIITYIRAQAIEIAEKGGLVKEERAILKDVRLCACADCLNIIDPLLAKLRDR